MAVPKQKKSRAKRDSRRSQHDKMTAPAVAYCSRCGAAKLPHRVCETCGFYGGRQVIQVAQEAFEE